MKRSLFLLWISLAALHAQESTSTIPEQTTPDILQTIPTPAVPPPQMGGIIQTGYAWSMDVVLTNPDPSIWGTSEQGFDAKVGSSQFVTLGVWSQMTEVIQTDITFTFFLPFHYQKFQTDTATQDTSVRFFDLTHQNIMLTVRFLPGQSYALSLQDYIFSVFGEGGVGASSFTVTNFHTVAFDRELGVTSTTDIANRTLSPSLAAQVGTGVRIQHASSRLTLDIIGRLYKGGTFTTNATTVQNTADSGGSQITTTPWQGQFQATQILVSLNINI